MASDAPDVPIDVTCPVCSGRTCVQIKYDNKGKKSASPADTQPEAKPLEKGYTFRGEQICSCDRLLRVYLCVTAASEEGEL